MQGPYSLARDGYVVGWAAAMGVTPIYSAVDEVRGLQPDAS